MLDEQEEQTIYKVVVNHEEQYSFGRPIRLTPWARTMLGESGTKDECLAYSKEVWTDIGPLSRRKRMQEQGLV